MGGQGHQASARLSSSAQSGSHRVEGGWVWDLSVQVDALPFLLDHRVRGVPIMPGSMYIELALTFVFRVLPERGHPLRLEELVFPHALALDTTDGSDVRMSLKTEADGALRFTCEEVATGTLCASMRICFPDSDDSRPDTGSIAGSPHCANPGSGFYSALRERGNDYGAQMQAVSRYHRDSDGLRAHVTVPGGGDFHLHPAILDAGIQGLAMAYDAPDLPFVLTGIDQIKVLGPPPRGGGMLCARLTHPRARTDREAIGAVTIYDGAGRPRVEATGIRLRHIESAAPRAVVEPQPAIPIAVSATFTAEPVESSLLFWGDELGIPLEVQFAPYNQVFQQLLDPASLLRTNRHGANVILLRLQDWEQGAAHERVGKDPERTEKYLAGHARRKLPNGLEIAQLNQYETDYLYQEIFVDRVYLRHGITLNDGDCVFDVGSNIGLFSLFVQDQCPNASIFAFEPSPPVIELLRANTALHCNNVTVCDYGISDTERDADFTFYKKSSVFSTFSADATDDEIAVRKVLENNLRQIGITEKAELQRTVDEFMTDRMASTSFTCRLRSLSDVIEEHGIARIDLLKIDAEKSELAILDGIKDSDWPKIRQIVLEVHDRRGDVVQVVKDQLTARGFRVTVEEEPLLRDSGLFTLYARRNDTIGFIATEPSTALANTTREFASALVSAAAASPVPYFVLSCPPTQNTDNEPPASRIRETEHSLARELQGVKNVHFVSSSALMDHYRVEDFVDPHAEALGHVPYHAEFYDALGTVVARRLDAVRRTPRKVIALDCDNTLWGGICGEDGPADVKVEGRWKTIQEFMVAQQEQGMLLCLCSKNAEEDVLAVFEAHPEMPLRMEHIVDRRINWGSKSENLISLSKSLNVGLDSFIFVDDDSIECAEVRTYCPAVAVLELPHEPDGVSSFLDHIWVFDRATLTEEDQSRTRLYRENQQREQCLAEVGSLKRFLDGLNLEVRVSSPDASQLPRVAQLTQRTNQFNATTIRRSESELTSLLDSKALSCRIVEVRDRFGDYGLVGVMLFSEERGSLSVDTFLLSCRVLGRGIEHRMLAALGEIALQHCLNTVEVPFVTTAKNAPVLTFLQSIGATHQHAETAQIFTIPAEEARVIRYDPDATCRREAGAGETDLVSAPIDERPPIDYSRIATKYQDAETIHRAVTERRHRVRASHARGYVPPANDQERAIAEIWEQVLGIRGVGVQHTFKELGGDSLTSVLLVSQLRRQLGAELSLFDLFDHPTVRALAEMLDTSRGKKNGQTNRPAGAERGARVRRRRIARRRADRE